MTVILPQFHHCDCEMREWPNFGTLFKLPCIVRIYAWFFMHCRNHHSDSHANHVIMLYRCALHMQMGSLLLNSLTTKYYLSHPPVLTFKVYRWSPWNSYFETLQWSYIECDGVSNRRRLNCCFKRRSKKSSKLRVTDLCEKFTSDRWIPCTKGQ